MSEIIERSKDVKYLFYKNMIESKGFVFQFHQRPYDVYNNGKDELRICEGCNILRVNNERINQPGMSILKPLINYLFNKK